MSIYAIADLHLSLGTDKPMDIFGGWQDYVPRLEANWNRVVRPEDTVVLPGDISWAMKLENAIEDFRFIERLPGRKVILKGNHDYWWSTMSKMDAFCASNGFTTISFLNAADAAERLVFLHYPPLYPAGNADEVLALLHEFEIKECWYGHLHGGAIRGAIQGEVDGIVYHLISADAVRFCPVFVR